MNETIKVLPQRTVGTLRKGVYLAGFTVLILALAGVYFFLPPSIESASVDKARALEALHTQADECGQAMAQNNHRALVDRTLPSLISMMGGREKYIARLEAYASEMKDSGVYASEMTVDQPEIFQVKSGVLYGVVPYKLLLKGPLFLSRNIDGQLIGMSTDRGLNWMFIDCTIFKGDRSQIKEILPDFPDELYLPSSKIKG